MRPLWDSINNLNVKCFENKEDANQYLKDISTALAINRPQKLKNERFSSQVQMLKHIFVNNLTYFTDNEKQVYAYWSEIKDRYSSKGRLYHNLNHLEAIIKDLQDVRDDINDWEVLLFSVFYHDIIYSPLRSNNEEASAQCAGERMKSLLISDERIEACKNQIIATKNHLESQDQDTNYLIDADLAILGKARNTYNEYCSNVRIEYWIYPNFLYNKGRKKFLRHSLQMDRIYKTEFFYNKYEKQARENLEFELSLL